MSEWILDYIALYVPGTGEKVPYKLRTFTLLQIMKSIGAKKNIVAVPAP